MKVVRVEKLGDICAFKPKEIQVVGSVYDMVPKESIEDLEAVLNKAKSVYDEKVSEAKSKGEKPKSAQYKSEVITEIVRPFLSKFGIEGKKKESKDRVISPKNPKITDAKDPVKIEMSEVDKKSAEEFYDNNFDADMLDDSVEKDEEKEVDLGEISDDFDLEDDFDFEGLN